MGDSYPEYVPFSTHEAQIQFFFKEAQLLSAQLNEYPSLQSYSHGSIYAVLIQSMIYSSVSQSARFYIRQFNYQTIICEFMSSLRRLYNTTKDQKITPGRHILKRIFRTLVSMLARINFRSIISYFLRTSSYHYQLLMNHHILECEEEASSCSNEDKLFSFLISC